MKDPTVKTYCITFYSSNINVATFLPAFAQYLYDSADILAFWNYIPLVYCVKSRLKATELTFKLQPFFPNTIFLIAEINEANINGVLPREAWEWFYLDHHEKTRAPQISWSQGLLPFLDQSQR
jgi:hypothetical protein